MSTETGGDPPQMPENATGGQNNVDASGGAEMGGTGAISGSGGVDAVDPGVGGVESSGGSGGTLGHAHDTPCLLRGSCVPTCLENPQLCLPCQPEEPECPLAFPVCDPVSRSCTECITHEDCLGQFGSDFGSCFGGKCVECLSTNDCSDPGEQCYYGWCGECAKDLDCPVYHICFQLKCMDYRMPPPAP